MSAFHTIELMCNICGKTMDIKYEMNDPIFYSDYGFMEITVIPLHILGQDGLKANEFLSLHICDNPVCRRKVKGFTKKKEGEGEGEA